MCKRVILVYPKINHEENYAYSWAPYALLAIAPSLREQAGLEVVLFDGNRRDIQSFQALLNDSRNRTICIGFSIMTGGGQIKHALKMAAMARNTLPDCPLVFGGPHVNVLPEQTLAHPLVDIVLVGPGQFSMPTLADALCNHDDFSRVPGLWMKKNGQTIAGPTNPFSKCAPQKYPWDLLDIPEYIQNEPAIADRTIGYVSSLGCPYRCRFCYESIYSGKYDAMSVQQVLNDIEYLVRHHHVNGIKFYDADFFVNHKRVEAFCTGLKKRNLNIRWAGSISPRDVLRMQRNHPELLKYMAHTGCSRLLMGLESGSDRVLREIVGKRTSVRDLYESAGLIARATILGSYTFIMGFPGESQDEIQETIRFKESLSALNPQPETRMHLYAPYPGTPLYEESLKHGFQERKSLEEWSSFNYYEEQTPWVDESLRALAKIHTRQQQSLRVAREHISGKTPERVSSLSDVV